MKENYSWGCRAGRPTGIASMVLTVIMLIAFLFCNSVLLPEETREDLADSYENCSISEITADLAGDLSPYFDLSAIKKAVVALEDGAFTATELKEMIFICAELKEMSNSILGLLTGENEESSGISLKTASNIYQIIFYGTIAAIVHAFVMHLLKKKYNGFMVPICLLFYTGFLYLLVAKYNEFALSRLGEEFLLTVSPWVWVILGCSAATVLLWYLSSNSESISKSKVLSIDSFSRVHGNQSKGWTCPVCNAVQSDANCFCGVCGSKRAVCKVRYCHNCGTKLEDKQLFCPKCGARRKQNAG